MVFYKLYQIELKYCVFGGSVFVGFVLVEGLDE